MRAFAKSFKLSFNFKKLLFGSSIAFSGLYIKNNIVNTLPKNNVN